MNDMNPLLDFSGLPRFSAVVPAHVTPAVDHLLGEARAVIERIATDASAPTWSSVVEPMADVLDRFDRAWGAVRHLNAVVNTPALRDAYNENLPKVIEFFTDLSQDLRLYGRYRALHEGAAYASLDAAQRKLVDNEIRDFKLGGAELDDAGKERLKAVHAELGELTTRFEENLLDATNAWGHYVGREAELAGLPRDVVSAARAAAEAEGKPGWKLTLRVPCYLPVMQYAEDRNLRRRMHEAYSTRASDLGSDPAWDNGPLIPRILALRHEAATLLGYRNYAEVSLVPKMAQHPGEVIAFLRDLARRAKPFAQRDIAELAAFAKSDLGLVALEPWDVAYASEKLKAARYSYDEQEVRQYLPEDRVLAGLFRVVESIYGLSIAAAQAETWHPDVRFFTIREKAGAGAVVGEFYFDLYARENKQGGAWMDDAINRRTVHGRVQHPVAYLTCNLSAPVDGKPATFTHDEVITIFHEFGHGLHQLLTKVDIPGISGLQGVEWDAVELPSQFMENFVWEWDVLSHMTGHVDTGAPMPRALFDRLVAARNFERGMYTVRQIEMGLFDMLVHAEYESAEGGASRAPQSILAEVRREVAVVPRAPYDRFMESFTHVFAGGYAAGYYSYQWAEVLSADAYSLFEERGVLSAEAGARFRDEVLARGGSRTALESFVAFRGRPPQLDALLRHNGMVESV
ncbi:MAG: M3 family metallopeptidase [Burkholderiales bacterium]